MFSIKDWFVDLGIVYIFDIFVYLDKVEDILFIYLWVWVVYWEFVILWFRIC